MSREAMERAFSQVPNGHNANALGKVYQHLLNTGERINEDIVGVMVAAPGDSRPFDRVALVVTPSMIVEVAPDGAVQVWRYGDLSSLTMSGGRKKLIGRDFMFLRGQVARGSRMLNWLLPTGYYEHNAPIGQIAEDACRRAQMNNL